LASLLRTGLSLTEIRIVLRYFVWIPVRQVSQVFCLDTGKTQTDTINHNHIITMSLSHLSEAFSTCCNESITSSDPCIITTKKRIKVILVVGACALDRLITVPNYPVEDSKIRSTGYQECCGGNAANVAITIQKLSDAHLFRSKGSFYKVRLCTKIGTDTAGKQILKELQEAHVDITSPLFRVVEETTTNIVHVIVNSSKTKTRTCIFTPGTCGDLTLRDVQSCSFDELFKNVVHVHTDGRHTEAANLLIQEAKRIDPSITTSIDSERDRFISEYDQILFAADMIFTNPQSIRDGFIQRLGPKQETGPVAATGCQCSVCAFLSASNLYRTSLCFVQNGIHAVKHVVVMLGGQGAVSITPCFTGESSESTDKHESNIDYISFHHERDDSGIAGDVYKASLKQRNVILEGAHPPVCRTLNYVFDVRLSGVLDSTIDIVDTTGAGDAFIGAYLLFFLMDRESNEMKVSSYGSSSCLNFACWVSGHKIRGTESVAVPMGSLVDESLGRTQDEVSLALQRQLLPFQIIADAEPLR
jgi:sugar/nucleoside kinase (ribokinase family)